MTELQILVASTLERHYSDNINRIGTQYILQDSQVLISKAVRSFKEPVLLKTHCFLACNGSY